MEPSYLKLAASGELARRAERAMVGLAPCRTCPRECGVDRLSGETGLCTTGRRARVASYSLHFGEEAPLVGSGGSGTVFFAGCGLGCDFCQNRDISADASRTTPVAPNQLAWIFCELKRQGAHNINLVTPSHVVPQILQALPLAVADGLDLPLVYNTSAYDRVRTLEFMDGVVDIYMPDAKFADSGPAARFCRAPDYPEVARAAILEMHRQVGDLVLDDNGLARRGLLVRHLVMPDGLAGTGDWMEFLARKVSRETYVNIMDQYRPCGLAHTHGDIDRPVTPQEYAQALEAARANGLDRLDDRRARGVFRFMPRGDV